jgi:predicted nucleic acid-binding protein
MSDSTVGAALTFIDTNIWLYAFIGYRPNHYTEDMHDGLLVNNQLTIRNPF